MPVPGFTCILLTMTYDVEPYYFVYLLLLHAVTIQMHTHANNVILLWCNLIYEGV